MSVTVRQMMAALFAIAMAAATAAAGPVPGSSTGTLCGELSARSDQGVANVPVYIFNAALGPPPSLVRYWRVPDAVVRTDSEGRFCVDVLPGKIFVLGLKKPADRVGPPETGDQPFLRYDSAGRAVAYVVGPGISTEAGPIPAVPEVRPGTARYDGPGITAVSGSVVGADGKPVPKAIVFAYTDAEMKIRPLFVSDPTDALGRYTIRFHQGGKYFLAAVTADGRGSAHVAGGGKLMAVKVATEEKAHDIQVKVGSPR